MGCEALRGATAAVSHNDNRCVSYGFTGTTRLEMSNSMPVGNAVNVSYCGCDVYFTPSVYRINAILEWRV